MNKKEAIEIIKKNWPDSRYTMLQEALQTLIPELKESEDEMIRQDIIDWLINYKDNVQVDLKDEEVDRWVSCLEKQGEQENLCDKCRKEQPSHSCQDITALGRCALEKQGEQKPVECIKFDNEFENQISHLIASVLNGEHEYNEGFVKYASQSLLGFAKKEQKSIEQDTEIRDLWVYIREWNEKFGRLPKDEDELAVCIDYVMKRHKESKQEWSKEDSERLLRIHQFIWANRKGDTDEVYQQEQDAEWLMTLNPQPKQVWSEENEKMFDKIYSVLHQYGYASHPEVQLSSNDAVKLIVWLKSLKDRVQPQPKQDWSEKDTKILNEIIDGLTPYGECPDYPSKEEQEYYYTRQEMIDWLKSLKDRVQPKQEWNEEDKSMYIRTLGILGKCYMGELPTKVEEELRWLKSIKPNHWKPSKEQMEIVENLLACEMPPRHKKIFESLYNDLKNLRS